MNNRVFLRPITANHIKFNWSVVERVLLRIFSRPRRSITCALAVLLAHRLPIQWPQESLLSRLRLSKATSTTETPSHKKGILSIFPSVFSPQLTPRDVAAITALSGRIPTASATDIDLNGAGYLVRKSRRHYLELIKSLKTITSSSFV